MDLTAEIYWDDNKLANWFVKKALEDGSSEKQLRKLAASQAGFFTMRIDVDDANKHRVSVQEVIDSCIKKCKELTGVCLLIYGTLVMLLDWEDEATQIIKDLIQCLDADMMTVKADGRIAIDTSYPYDRP